MPERKNIVITSCLQGIGKEIMTMLTIGQVIRIDGGKAVYDKRKQ